MNYNKYLKDLGMTRKMFWHLKHKGIRNEFERIKYGSNYHEMWGLDTILACEIYYVSENTHDFSHGMNRLHMLLKYSKQILINT
jgi:hypothetical protein